MTIFLLTKGSAAPAPASASLDAFDRILSGSYATYLDLSKKIGDEVAKQADLVDSAFKAQRTFLV